MCRALVSHLVHKKGTHKCRGQEGLRKSIPSNSHRKFEFSLSNFPVNQPPLPLLHSITMDESLLSNDHNNQVNNDVLSASQASLQRSSSLLERIRAQREREAMAATSSTNTNAMDYNPISTNDTQHSRFGASSLNFSGLIRGFGDSNTEATQGLLETHSEQYSMSAYFRMLVMDLYTFFRSLPIPVQAFTIVFMLWIIYHMI